MLCMYPQDKSENISLLCGYLRTFLKRLYSLTHSLSHTVTQSLTHSLTHSIRAYLDTLILVFDLGDLMDSGTATDAA